MKNTNDSILALFERKMLTQNFKDIYFHLQKRVGLLNKRELSELFEKIRSIKANKLSRVHKFKVLNLLIYELKEQYAVDFSLSEMVYTLLNKNEQEYFLEIIDTSRYPYVKLDFEADEVRRRVWEKKLYFEFNEGYVTQIELYYNESNPFLSFEKNLRRLRKFKNLRRLNLLFFCGFPNNLIRTRVLELKVFSSLEVAKIYKFDEENPIPFQIRYE